MRMTVHMRLLNGSIEWSYQNEGNRTTLTAECVSAGSEPSDVLTSFKERVMMQPYIAIVWPEYPVGVAPTYSVLKTAAELSTDGYIRPYQ